MVNNFVVCCMITIQSYDTAKMGRLRLSAEVCEGMWLFGFCPSKPSFVHCYCPFCFAGDLREAVELFMEVV